uniref:Uncharacterized protein n=1 Tax=Ananas comosus var. bracteatus TaxID=296719 RepID=A0A6V7QL59_ANACO|nr:unnamed protein product [Ananas comosus var. bracteatus]
MKLYDFEHIVEQLRSSGVDLDENNLRLILFYSDLTRWNKILALIINMGEFSLLDLKLVGFILHHLGSVPTRWNVVVVSLGVIARKPRTWRDNFASRTVLCTPRFTGLI